MVVTGAVERRHEVVAWYLDPRCLQMVLQHEPTDVTVVDRLTVDYETVSIDVSTCPECESSVVDGQGLLGCVDCDWHGLVA